MGRRTHMHIISRESINSSPIPQFQKPTFRRAKSLSSKLNIPPPLSSRRSAHPPPSQISLCNSATQVAIITNTRPNSPVYTWKKSKRPANFVLSPYGGGFWEVENNQIVPPHFMLKILKKSQTFSMPSHIHLLLPHHLTNDFAAE